MKYRSALAQSTMSVKFLTIAILVLAGLVYVFARWWFWIPLIIAVLSWGIDAYNIHWIRKRAAADPTFLDQQLE